MKSMLAIIFSVILIACNPGTEPDNNRAGNPFFTGLNESVQYADISHKHIEEYARITAVDAGVALEAIRSVKLPDFRNVFVAFDEVVNELNKAGSNCFMLYWVSTDSLSRIKGLEGYQLLDSLATSLTADSSIYSQMVAFAGSKAYGKLKGHRKIFVDDVMQSFEHAGVNLAPGPLTRFKELRAEISELSAEYSTNMNTANEILVLDEAMAQIFENWIWDYETLGSFARHYQTDEPLPRALFDKMYEAKNITSGLDAQRSLRNCVYDMMLYDAYDPENPTPTDEIWKEIDRQFALPMYIEGTHPQASWIHINTHPTYYYGYLWAEVYAQDMFTIFEENGLRHQETGKRYRKLILANGTQRDIVEAVEEFLGRPSNNEAYIKSLGLN